MTERGKRRTIAECQPVEILGRTIQLTTHQAIMYEALRNTSAEHPLPTSALKQLLDQGKQRPRIILDHLYANTRAGLNHKLQTEQISQRVTSCPLLQPETINEFGAFLQPVTLEPQDGQKNEPREPEIEFTPSNVLIDYDLNSIRLGNRNLSFPDKLTAAIFTFLATNPGDYISTFDLALKEPIAQAAHDIHKLTYYSAAREVANIESYLTNLGFDTLLKRHGAKVALDLRICLVIRGGEQTLITNPTYDDLTHQENRRPLQKPSIQTPEIPTNQRPKKPEKPLDISKIYSGRVAEPPDAILKSIERRALLKDPSVSRLIPVDTDNGHVLLHIEKNGRKSPTIEVSVVEYELITLLLQTREPKLLSSMEDVMENKFPGLSRTSADFDKLLQQVDQKLSAWSQSLGIDSTGRIHIIPALLPGRLTVKRTTDIREGEKEPE